MGWQVRSKKQRKYNAYKGEPGKIAPNLLQRNFSATKPNEKWLTDMTEFKVKEEKLYFSPILDCFNNELVAYQMSRSPNGMLVQKMLLQAVEKLREMQIWYDIQTKVFIIKCIVIRVY